MRVAKGEVDGAAPQFSLISHADSPSLAKILRDARNGVRHQSARRAVYGRVLVALAFGRQFAVFQLEADSPLSWNRDRQFPFGPSTATSESVTFTFTSFGIS